jgi:hypothetical protein
MSQQHAIEEEAEEEEEEEEEEDALGSAFLFRFEVGDDYPRSIGSSYCLPQRLLVERHQIEKGCQPFKSTARNRRGGGR